MQCGIQPADISVIHRRFKDAAHRVAHPGANNAFTHKESKNVKKIARINPAPVDKGGPYQSVKCFVRRKASATMVKVGLACPAVGKTELPAT